VQAASGRSERVPGLLLGAVGNTRHHRSWAGANFAPLHFYTGLDMPKTLIEPFRIKSIEPIRMTTREERVTLLEAAKLNVFKLHAEDVLIDWLTDSGTGAMSSKQWGAIMEGDESYAGARSFYRLESVIQDITGMKFFVPTHQGRAAEKVLFTAVCKKADVVPNNCHFDTTRANLEYLGIEALDLVIAEGLQPSTIHPFKGNIDLERVEALLKTRGENIPFGMVTVTNNTGGGQPVSMANIRAYAALLKKYGKPLIMDVCRFSENAMFIKMREPGYQNTPIKTIVQEMFSYADGATMSAKKDGMVNIGGFIVLRSEEWMDAVRNGLILTEGFPTYGGLAGRDLEALAVGLVEGMQEDYLRYRLRTAEYLGERLEAAGVGFVKPTGGHAVYIDARTVLPHMPVAHYPAWALCNALYLEGGIRGVEIGSVMFGKRLADGTETYHSMELVRLAFPRRMYTQSHFDYAAEVIAELKEKASEIRGVKITKQPQFLRHFTCECAWEDGE
jgi:tryptophanase